MLKKKDLKGPSGPLTVMTLQPQFPLFSQYYLEPGKYSEFLMNKT